MLVVPERRRSQRLPGRDHSERSEQSGHAEVLALPRVTRETVDYSSSSSATARSTAATLPEVLASG
jgi:hypothetical protein